MEAISIILIIVFFLLLLAALVGVVKPSLVRQQTRMKAFFGNLGAAFVTLILIGIVAPSQNTPKEAVVEDKQEIIAQNAKEEKGAGKAEPMQSKAPEGRAQPYEVIGAEDYSFPGRKRVRWQIVAPSAQSRGDRAFTAIQAAKDLLKKTEADQATVWLEINKELAGKGYGLAIVSFTPDGKGNSGQEANSEVWEVEVAADEVSAEQVRIANAWYANRSKFVGDDGLTDEPRLKTYLASELGIPESQISLPWVMREKFAYNGETYAVAGTRMPSDVKESESFSKSKCQMDLQCWGDKHNVAAGVYCDDYVEKLAKYSHEWTDGMLEPKFSHFRWKDRSKGYITYIGDKIKFQNGFGAWQNYVYECDLDPETNTVLDVRAQPGRL